MHKAATALLVGFLGTSAWAADDDERYLLGDYGVRIDLPEGWSSRAWSDSVFEAEADDRSVKLFVWGGGAQLEPAVGDIDAWARGFANKAESIEGHDVSVRGREVRTIAGRPTARVELTFALGAGLQGAMSGATFAVEGGMVHLATIAAERRSTLATEALEVMLGRLEARRPPKAAPEGQTVSAPGLSAKLPPGWRPAIGAEAALIEAGAAKLGVELKESCWSALHPRALAEPDVMITCPGGLLLGVVDAYSFSGVDAVIRKHIFGTTPVPPATSLTAASGQTGFLYRPELAGRTLAMAVVPYGGGIARTWVLGAPNQAAAFAESLTALVASSTLEGDHPTGMGDQVRYFLVYRPTSPITLAMGAGGLAVLGALLWLLKRMFSSGRRDYDEV